MNKQILAEVFGYLPDDKSEEAVKHRQHKLCPYNNIVPTCTKDKVYDPLGVCSMYSSKGDIAVICPVRFRQDWLVLQNAAEFFFPKDTKWTSLSEIRLPDKNGIPAGNIDSVLVAYDANGNITDFGALEVQAVYVSGNIRNVFNEYMKNSLSNDVLIDSAIKAYPHPDYLSSSRKRLAPQLLYKGGILHEWKKKMAIVVHSAFFNTLPVLQEVSKEEAEIAWLVYELLLDENTHRYKLTLSRTIYTLFETALEKITVAEAGNVESFEKLLQLKLKNKLNVKTADVLV